jgi:hypothetical protein
MFDLLVLRQVGRLNLLTPLRVAAAAKEIHTGEIVPVNYGNCILFWKLTNSLFIVSLEHSGTTSISKAMLPPLNEGRGSRCSI